MRTFLAVRPPAAALAHLAARVAGPPTEVERWHVTLAFLGEVDDPPALSAPLARVCAPRPPLVLRLAGSGAFGRGGPVWVGVDGDVTGLTALAGALADACRAHGIDVERRPYRPHLTVGRRGRPDPRSLAGYTGPAWTARSVELVVSRLGRTVRHEVVQALPLSG